MSKKQSTIDPKPLPSKPSFKNLLNLNEAKLPNRSKSKSRSTSQVKIGTVPNKSPKKLIHCNSNTSCQDVSVSVSSVGIGSGEKEGKEKEKGKREGKGDGRENREERTEVKYEDVASQISRSRNSRSPKRDHGRQNMRQIVILKNKALQIQQKLQATTQTLTAPTSSPTLSLSLSPSSPNPFPTSYIHPLQTSQQKLSTHLQSLHQISQKLQQSLSKQFEQLSKGANVEDVDEMGEALGRFQRRGRIGGMGELERKLGDVEGMLGLGLGGQREG